MDFLINFLIYLFLGVGGSLLVNGLLLRFSKTLGIRNKNDVSIRWSNESKPSLGGISMFASLIFSLIVFSIMFDSKDVFEDQQIVGLISAASLAFLIGIADDAYNTKPILKLIGQIFCGVILVYSGTVIEIFDSLIWNQLCTILWVIIIMNSLNMLDNMDGIAATVSFFILLTCLVVNLLHNGFNFSVLNFIVITQLGCLIGFLKYNIHPSKMFMGDTGSQFLSLLVAFISIHYLWNIDLTSNQNLSISWLLGFFITLAAFTPAAIDTLTVVINRLRRGKSPMVGGKDHTTHHLVYKGYTEIRVWIYFFGISILSSAIAVLILIGAIHEIKNIYILAILNFLFHFIYLYRITINYKKNTI